MTELEHAVARRREELKAKGLSDAQVDAQVDAELQAGTIGAAFYDTIRREARAEQAKQRTPDLPSAPPTPNVVHLGG